MDVLENPTPHDPLRPGEPAGETRLEAVTGTGSIAEAVGGAAAIVLAIVGLAGGLPSFLAAIAVIAMGCALVFQGGALATRSSRLLTQATNDRWAAQELGGGLSAELFGGLCGIVLGILALVQVYPAVLLPIAVIVFGGTVLLACGTMSGLNNLTVERYWGRNHYARRVAGELVSTATTVQALGGLAAIVLGIIGLAGAYPVTLALVAVLTLGSTLLLSSASISGRMMSMISR